MKTMDSDEVKMNEMGMNSCFAADGTTAKTRAHIKKALRDRLKSEYNCTKYKDFLRIQGFDDARFDYVGSVNNMMYADLTTDGIDNNANKSNRTVSRVQAECDNAMHKIAGHDFLYRQLKHNVGKEEAERLCAELYDYTLGINDSTSLLKIYCYCISGTGLVLEGRDGQPKCAPPKHLHSYVSMLAGTIHEMSNNALCGAIAVGTFFFDCARVLLMDGYDLDDIRNDKNKRAYIKNMFQQFVYDLSDKTRVACESPFTNVSVFGKYKMMALLEDMDWYFEDTGRSLEYVSDVVMELQELFLDLMDAGDPLSNGLPFTFPVVTICMTKDDNGELKDNDFIKRLCKRPVHRYNLFVSKGTKAASCCFDGEEKVKITSNGKDIELTFKELADSDYINDDMYVETPNGKKKCKFVSVPYNDKYYRFDFTNGEHITVTKDHLNPVGLTSFQDVRSDNVVEGMCFRTDIRPAPTIVSIKRVDGSQNAYCLRVLDKEPYFTLPNGIITHNCRLLSDTEMLDVASSSNSFGGGNALNVGSHRVVCINMPRVALRADSMDDFMKSLERLVKDSVTILRAHKDLIISLEKIGLQPYVTNGYIKMERLFSTVGILGIWEMFKTLEEKFGKDENRDITVMKAFNEMCLRYGKEAKLNVNIEAIPGESMAVRFAKADRLIFGYKVVPYKLYSNQTVPLTEHVDVYERMDRDGRINLLLTGGGIVHLTTGEKVTPEQAENLIKYAVKSNCEHFALNLVHSKCEDGHISEGKFDKCPTCGKPIVDYAMRIVGFLRFMSDWSKERVEEGNARYLVDISKIKDN